MKELFIKYIKRECTEEEIQQIISYFKNSKDFSDVPTIDAIYQVLEGYPDMDESSAKRISKDILAPSQRGKVIKIKHKRSLWKHVAAAVFVLALTSTYFLKDIIFNNEIETSIPVIVNNQIKPGVQKAILTVEDGSDIMLEKGVQYQNSHANSNGEVIIYNNDASQELVYNYITIPRGGQFKLTLSDGTQVWLNSETQLKYPVHFADGKSRQVELVYGEAYFDVSPSTEHKGAKFKVLNHTQEIEVLGTEFNVKAYRDETNIYTTLVEGKVEVNTSSVKEVLMPGNQSNLDVTNNTLTISQVDVKALTSWRDGLFSFKGKPLKDIMRVLSRWYDFEVVYEDKELGDLTFKGVLGKDQNIEEILSTIKSLSVIKNYEINNTTITLK